MAESNEQGRAGGATPPAKSEPKPFQIPDDFTLTVDRSRHFSEVHGEHAQNLGFIQDGIPFDKGGRLLPELCGAGKNDPFPNALAVIERKIKRRQSEERAAVKVTETVNPLNEIETVREEDPDADVDLVAWAKGDTRLPPHVLYRVATKRFAKHFRTYGAVAAEMVERKIIDPGEVKVT